MGLLLALVSLQLLISIETVASQGTGKYHPTGYDLIGSTDFVSGSLTNLQVDDNVYMTFRSYASQTSSVTFFAHAESIIVKDESYNLLKLDSADATGQDLSASMASTGRQLWGRFIYPLVGIKSIPGSTWTFYYRTSHSIAPMNSSASPSVSDPTGLWTDRDLAFLPDDQYAFSSVPNSTQVYGNYLFNLPSGAQVTKVEVGYEAFTETDENINLTVSWDGGNSWATEYASPQLGTSDTDTTIWVDFTGATEWTASKLSNTKFLTRIKAVKNGLDMGEVNLDWIPTRVTYYVQPSAHADVDILIRGSDGSIKDLIATDVANSANLTITQQTISGTYSWASYVVESQTDYLEIDYYLDVRVASSGTTGILRIDDNTLGVTDQTRTTISGGFPTEYAVEIEFTGSSDTYYWSEIVWAVDSAWTESDVSVTLQLYNYALGAYPTSGRGYVAYTSASTPDTDETRSQTITTDPSDFRNSTGNWKLRVKGVKTTNSQFDFKADLVKLETEAPPNATFTFSPSAPLINQTVTFNASLSTPNRGTIVRYFWDFGDGNDVNTKDPVIAHVYTSGGIYLVVLNVTDSEGLSATQSKSIIVGESPRASFSFSPSSPIVNREVAFNASSSYDPDGTIIDYDWDFGDGIDGSGAAAVHLYASAGVYNVTLSVVDNDGFVNSTFHLLTVHLHDVVVVSVSLSTTEVYKGQSVGVTVVLKNNGTTAESFGVTLLINGTAIERRSITGLAPGAEEAIEFVWNTTDAVSGANYVLIVAADIIPGELSTDNNEHLGEILRINAQVQVQPFDWSTLLYVLPMALVLIALLAARSWHGTSGAGLKSPTPFEDGFLNVITGGGIPDAFSVMIVGDAGAGKSMLCQQLIYTYLRRGEPCLYVTYDSFPDEIRKGMKGFNWDLSTYERDGSFKFVDCYSSIAGVSSQEEHSVKHPFSLSELSITISAAVDDLKKSSAKVFLDSTAALFTRLQPSQVVEFLQDRSAIIKGENGVFFFTVGRGTVPIDLLRRLEETVDCVIELDVQEEKGRRLRRLRVKILRGRRFLDTWIPFRIHAAEGIVLSLPKNVIKDKK